MSRQLLRYGIHLKSWLGSRLKSDTLTGQLLCLYRERNSNEALENWIERFKAGEPPFILSDAFPHDFLPTPALPALPRDDLQKKYEQDVELFQQLKWYKTFKKKFRWMRVKEWLELRENISPWKLFEFYSQKKNEAEEKPGNIEMRQLQLHNSINRGTGAVLEGFLYTSEDYWYHSTEGKPALDIYVEIDETYLEEFQKLLKDLEIVGFGGNRSTGKGQLTFELDESTEFQSQRELLLKMPQTTAWLNLSTYSSFKRDDLRGYYQTETKFSKAWSGFGQTNPFKFPLLVFKAGSVFKDKPGYANTVITGIHPIDESIIQCCSPIMFPFCLEEWKDAQTN